MAEWFASWFDSPYYPVLYRHRDHTEAMRFLDRLLVQLRLPQGAHCLDLACGRGRHSLHLHQKGYRVTGLDLSPESIADASLHRTDGLDFGVHDMRLPFPAQYDCILNLFTSFGYFATDQEHAQVLDNVANALLPGGVFVMDYLNAHKVAADLQPSQEQEVNGIHFRITKRIQEGRIIKLIEVDDPTASSLLHYAEEVRLFTLEELKAMLAKAGMEVQLTWGDYTGGAFDPGSSPRLILFARHTHG